MSQLLTRGLVGVAALPLTALSVPGVALNQVQSPSVQLREGHCGAGRVLRGFFTCVIFGQAHGVQNSLTDGVPGQIDGAVTWR